MSLKPVKGRARVEHRRSRQTWKEKRGEHFLILKYEGTDLRCECSCGKQLGLFLFRENARQHHEAHREGVA